MNTGENSLVDFLAKLLFAQDKAAARAAERAATWEPTPLVQYSAMRDVGRTRLAAGDTAGAIKVWRDYLMQRGRAEPAQRATDDELRARIAELERGRK